jgi:hypothetical protein
MKRCYQGVFVNQESATEMLPEMISFIVLCILFNVIQIHKKLIEYLHNIVAKRIEGCYTECNIKTGR